jgi:hypothetical protein
MQRSDGTILGEHAIVDHKNYFRDMCVFYFERNPIQIGGPGRHVQIDESFVTKRLVIFENFEVNLLFLGSTIEAGWSMTRSRSLVA